MIKLDIRKTLGAFTLDVQCNAPAGVTALFGPSGSGKTSVVNAVAGLLMPDAGAIKVGETVLFDSATKVSVPVHKRRVGYVFQDARLFPHLSVLQNLRYGGQYDEEQVIEVLGMRDLLSRMPSGLSGGEKQRVALGRALMSNPQILLMDEPLAALDVARKAEILPYIERLRDIVKVPILYVSHDVSEVARLATTLVVLDGGKVGLCGPVGQILSHPQAVPFIGVRSAGAVITARVAGYFKNEGLTELAFSGGRLVLPGKIGTMGKSLRLRIPAQDVILAKTAPAGISALNVLPVEITQIEHGHGPGVAVGLRAGTDVLLARVTRRSAAQMELAVGQRLFAIIKATAVGPEDIGH